MEYVIALILGALALLVYQGRKLNSAEALNDQNEVKDKANVIDSVIYKLKKDLEAEKQKRESLPESPKKEATDAEIIDFYNDLPNRDDE